MSVKRIFKSFHLHSAFPIPSLFSLWIYFDFNEKMILPSPCFSFPLQLGLKLKPQRGLATQNPIFLLCWLGWRSLGRQQGVDNLGRHLLSSRDAAWGPSPHPQPLPHWENTSVAQIPGGFLVPESGRLMQDSVMLKALCCAVTSGAHFCHLLSASSLGSSTGAPVGAASPGIGKAVNPTFCAGGGHPHQACLVQEWQLCGSGVALGFPVLAPPWGVHGTSLGCPSHLSPGLWRKKTTARHPELTPKSTLGICTGFYRGCACLSLPGATRDPSAGPWRGTGDASPVCGNIHVLVPCHCPKSSVCSHFPDR